MRNGTAKPKQIDACSSAPRLSTVRSPGGARRRRILGDRIAAPYGWLMSSTLAIALICANTFPGFFCFHYVLKLANDVGAEVATAVIRGVPISRTYRGIMLYQVWIGYVLGAVSIGSLVAVLNWSIAELVHAGLVQTAAYLASVIAAVGALGCALNAASGLIHFRRLMREMK